MPSLTLADLIGGQQGNPVQSAGTGDPGYQQRKQGWVQSLNQMVQDPVNAMTLMQIGNSMQNIQPGQNAATQFTNALTSGLNYRSQYQHAMEKRRMDERKQGREDRRVGYEGERVGLSREELELRNRQENNRATIDAEKLDIARDRNRIAEISARRPLAGSIRKPSETDKLTKALMETKGVTEAEARIMATQMELKQDRPSFINAVVAKSLVMEPLPGQEPTSAEDIVRRAGEAWDMMNGTQEGPSGQEGTMMEQWNQATPEQKEAARVLARESDENKAEFIRRFGSANL